MVIDEYFYGNYEVFFYDMCFVGKSVILVVVGVVKFVGVKFLFDIDVYVVFGCKVDDFLLFLCYLLMMSFGWVCDDDDGNLFGNEGIM